RRPAAAAPPPAAATAQARPRARKPKRAEPARRPLNKAVGKVHIRERTDTGRLMLMIVVAAVIIGAVGFLIMRYL
ncbi:MAG: hypothetical protein ACYTGU_08670, partial [Planctomycetota bacterium]